MAIARAKTDVAGSHRREDIQNGKEAMLSSALNWYLAFIIVRQEESTRSDGNRDVESCGCLLRATTHEEAYTKSLDLGSQLAALRSQDSGLRQHQGWEFLGIQDLMRLHESPTDGNEVLWSETELSAEEIEREIRPKQELGVFKGPAEHNTKWYLAHIVVEEVHDEGSHGSKSLIWVNSYLIEAQSSDEAYARAIMIGKEQEDEPGSHRCDGERAHWLFRGLRDLIPAGTPVDGGTLWCERVVAGSEEIDHMVRNKSQLSIFQAL